MINWDINFPLHFSRPTLQEQPIAEETTVPEDRCRKDNGVSRAYQKLRKKRLPHKYISDEPINCTEMFYPQVGTPGLHNTLTISKSAPHIAGLPSSRSSLTGSPRSGSPLSGSPLSESPLGDCSRPAVKKKSTGRRVPVTGPIEPREKRPRARSADQGARPHMLKGRRFFHSPTFHSRMSSVIPKTSKSTIQ